MLAQNLASVSVGDQVGRYQLVKRIGRGGMGEVWKARLGGPFGVETYFALKFVLDSVDQALARGQQLDEARLASRIRGPHVAALIEVIDMGRGLALVMEWIDGVSLAQLRRHVPILPLGIALRITADACAGLHLAHELADDQGVSLEIVHRDVSPQNLMIGRDGATRVIDFGIAKARDRVSPQTTSGIRGKVSYMSVEHASGKQVDRRADIFALGVVLYEMLSGQLPFGDTSDIEILRALSAAEPFRPIAVPAAILRVLQRALAHDREKRFATALAMRKAVESAMRECNLDADEASVSEYLRRSIAPDPTPTGDEILSPAQSTDEPTVVVGATLGLSPMVAVPGLDVRAGAEVPLPRRFTHALRLALGGLLLLGVLAFAFARLKGENRHDDGERRAAPTAASTVSSIIASIASSPALAPSPPAPSVVATMTMTPLAHTGPTARPTKGAGKKCNPPFELTSDGHKRYRPECLR